MYINREMAFTVVSLKAKISLKDKSWLDSFLLYRNISGSKAFFKSVSNYCIRICVS